MVFYSEMAKPSLQGKVIIITGASSGIGLEAARIFVKEHGAHVIMACRNLAKAQPLADELNSAGPGKASLLKIDTSDPNSVRQFVADFRSTGLDKIDVLLLNAGIMAVPYRTVPFGESSIESQFATNHLGHFLLTTLLLPTIIATPESRIVAVSSVAANMSKALDYDVLCGKAEPRFRTWHVYGNTKLANLLFIKELRRRLKAAGASTVALPCHPGYSTTNLQSHFDNSFAGKLEATIIRPLMSQSPVEGAHPLVLACIDPEPNMDGPGLGSYYAPGRMFECKGDASSTGAKTPKLVKDAAAAELWTRSEELCGETSTI